jgi:hypothetical protein
MAPKSVQLCVSRSCEKIGCFVWHQVLIDGMLVRKVREGDACQRIITDTRTAKPWYHSVVEKFGSSTSRGVTPVEKIGCLSRKLPVRRRSLKYLQFGAQSSTVLQFSRGVDGVSLCSHKLRQPVAEMSVTGTWQVNSLTRGKSHLRLGLCAF